MSSDIEIAQRATLRKISDVAADKLGIAPEHLEAYGQYKAKLSPELSQQVSNRPDGKLILVTAMTPTPAGEGKTTTTVGLGDALNLLGKKAAICIREPSLGPVFGMKGGAAGGGYAQVVPMEDINLHFTGDFGAISLANNLLAALLDNHIHHGNELGIDVRRIGWRRVIDMNDRALRDIVVSLGGVGNGYPRQDGFDIVAASEVMAILCLSNDLATLKQRLGNIVVGSKSDRKPVRARDLGADGAMTVLLKDAIKPNLVQTLENNPAFIHGGPFANIAHGCNSVVATRTALKLADYVVTEAGFGADLGAEKFVDIKCRKAGLKPSGAVIVATIRALKYHGGIDLKSLSSENLDALSKGLANLERHVENVRQHYGLPCVVAVNRFTSDTQAEVDLVVSRMKDLGTQAVMASHWADGGKGALDLAQAVVAMCESPGEGVQFVYRDEDTLWEKVEKVAQKIYRASKITAPQKIRDQIKRLQDDGYGNHAVCIAKTQYSFTTDASKRGAPVDHTIDIREVRLSAGAEFVVVVCGDIMTMPGLPKVPAAQAIDIDANGKIVGLF
jgi:formate--tetrahydrofolate ligase